MTEPNMTLCLAWYRRDQWFLLKQKVADPENIEDTFDEWERKAEKAYQEIKSQGENVVKVDVDIYELEEWCRLNNVPMDGDARSNFAGEKGQDLYDMGFDF